LSIVEAETQAETRAKWVAAEKRVQALLKEVDHLKSTLEHQEREKQAAIADAAEQRDQVLSLQRQLSVDNLNCTRAELPPSTGLRALET